MENRSIIVVSEKNKFDIEQSDGLAIRICGKICLLLPLPIPNDSYNFGLLIWIMKLMIMLLTLKFNISMQHARTVWSYRR